MGAFEWGMVGLGIGLFALIVIAIRQEARSRELTHAERMKAIEAGFPPPDVAVSRNKALGWVLVIVPTGCLGIAASMTRFLSDRSAEQVPPWLLAVIWGVSGLVALLIGLVALAMLRGSGLRTDAVGRRLAPPAFEYKTEPNGPSKIEMSR